MKESHKAIREILSAVKDLRDLVAKEHRLSGDHFRHVDAALKTAREHLTQAGAFE